MNVEQLIEEGANSAGLVEPGPRSCFALGVRHALAAMFPVVKVEELKPGVFYAATPKGQGLKDVRCVGVYEGSGHFAFVDQHGYVDIVTTSMFTEFRRCPTPSELGVV